MTYEESHSPTDQAKVPGPLKKQYILKSRNGGPASFSRWIGKADLQCPLLRFARL